MAHAPKPMTMLVAFASVMDSLQKCFLAGFAFAYEQKKGWETGRKSALLSEAHLPRRHHSCAGARKGQVCKGAGRASLGVAAAGRAAIALQRHVGPRLRVEPAAKDVSAGRQRRGLAGRLADRVDEPSALADLGHVAEDNVPGRDAQLGARLGANVDSDPPAGRAAGGGGCFVSKSVNIPA